MPNAMLRARGTKVNDTISSLQVLIVKLGKKVKQRNLTRREIQTP